MNPARSSDELMSSRGVSGRVHEPLPMAHTKREPPLNTAARGNSPVVHRKAYVPDYLARERLVSAVFYALGILCLLLAGVVWWQLLRELP